MSRIDRTVWIIGGLLAALPLAALPLAACPASGQGRACPWERGGTPSRTWQRAWPPARYPSVPGLPDLPRGFLGDGGRGPVVPGGFDLPGWNYFPSTDPGRPGLWRYVPPRQPRLPWAP